MFQPLIENLYRSLEWHYRSVIQSLQFWSIMLFLVSQVVRSQNLTLFQEARMSVSIGQIISRNTLICSLESTNNGSQLYLMILFSYRSHDLTIYYRLCKRIDFLSNWIASSNVLYVHRFEFILIIIYPINDNMAIHWHFSAIWRHSYWDILCINQIYYVIWNVVKRKDAHYIILYNDRCWFISIVGLWHSSNINPHVRQFSVLRRIQVTNTFKYQDCSTSVFIIETGKNRVKAGRHKIFI